MRRQWKDHDGEGNPGSCTGHGREIFFEGRPLDRSKNGLKAFRKEAQMVFQDPYQSLNPRNRIIDLVAEPLDVNHLVHSPEERLEK